MNLKSRKSLLSSHNALIEFALRIAESLATADI